MDTYSLLREFADSWALLFLFAFFLGACIWAFWPGRGDEHSDAAGIPLRDDRIGCSGSCDECQAKNNFLKERENV
ncbi:MAG: cbb3-type cytochrome c oxidase subunit 3 [Pseudomonadota bacterium]